MHIARRTWVRNRLLVIALAASVGAGGCALPELSPAGAGVRLVSADAVQDDLNVTARNSAANMGADTIVPASKVEDGKQAFNVYRCLRR